MEKMGLNDIREAFLKFWESKGHYRLKSFPLIPQHDKSLLIINSGMAPMKAFFDAAEYYLQIEDFDPDVQVIENHLL